MSRAMILSQAISADASRARTVALALGGSVLIALSAQVSVPMLPVPMTLQTLTISLLGLACGWRVAGGAVLAYLAQGAAGLPVFANGTAGIAPLMGPTAGFLWGFVMMAVLTGWLAENGLGRGLLRAFVAAAVPALLLYVPGVLWLAAVTPLDVAGSAQAGALPFLPGDLVKSAVAALVVTGGWAALRGRRA